MSDAYSILPSIFSDDPRTGALTYDQLQARRKIALALATRNRPYPKTIGEGLTAFGEGLGEGFANDRLSKSEAVQTAGDAAALRPPSGAVPPPAPSVAPAIPRAPVGRTSMEGDDATQSLAYAAPAEATDDKQPLTPAQASQQPQMPVEEWMQRIDRNESGGRKDAYTLVGERSRRGDYPYGKYQIMGENVPAWTQAYLGKKMTPEEFLADPDAQDKVARARGGEYLTKYGPNGAAAAWFAGEKGMKDETRPNLQAHIAEYQRRFNIPLVSRDQVAASVANNGGAPPVQVASLGGMPTPDTAPAPARDAVAQSLVSQQGVQPPPQQVAQAQPLPVPPTALPQPIAPQRTGPQVPAFPAYGNEPKPPQPTPDMMHYRRVAADPYRSEQTRATAMQLYTEMKSAQDAEFARTYELWKANELKHRDYQVGLPKAQEDLTGAYLENLKKPQGIISSQPGPVPQGPVPQAQSTSDPRLGTNQSPQRSGVPSLPPVPAGTSPDKWSELQAPVMSSAVEAVQKAQPMFDDAIRVIQTARTHPGREYGLGVSGIVARQVPQTDAYAFGKINDQMVGKTFLTAYNTLKGGGQISNVEGEKAQIAQARIDPKQNPKDYDAALNDLEHQLRRDQEIAQRKVNMPVTAWRAPGDNSSFAPDIGERRGNHEYVGGNPRDPASWKKIQ